MLLTLHHITLKGEQGPKNGVWWLDYQHEAQILSYPSKQFHASWTSITPNEINRRFASTSSRQSCNAPMSCPFFSVCFFHSINLQNKSVMHCITGKLMKLQHLQLTVTKLFLIIFSNKKNFLKYREIWGTWNLK